MTGHNLPLSSRPQTQVRIISKVIDHFLKIHNREKIEAGALISCVFG
jgi:hypothetical protein